MFKQKLFLTTILFAFLATFNAKAQVYEKGNVIIDAYYGFPNLLTSLVKTSYQNSTQFGSTNPVKISSIGPIGGKIEYVLSNRIGLGINVNYANTSVKGDYDVMENGKTVTYTYKASVPRLRIMPTLSVHLGNSDKLDP